MKKQLTILQVIFFIVAVLTLIVLSSDLTDMFGTAVKVQLLLEFGAYVTCFILSFKLKKDAVKEWQPLFLGIVIMSLIVPTYRAWTNAFVLSEGVVHFVLFVSMLYVTLKFASVVWLLAIWIVKKRKLNSLKPQPA